MDQPARSKRKLEDENLDPVKNQKGEMTPPHSSDLSSGLVRSTDAQQKDANALVDKLGPYEGDNIPALLNLIADQLDQLRPFFAPEGEGADRQCGMRMIPCLTL